MPWLLGAAKLLLVVQAAAADSTVLGTIVDGAGGTPLAGAVVTLPGLHRTTVSDAHGRYAFASLPPGPQRISVAHLGYAPRTVQALVPSAGVVRIDFALHAEPFRLPAIDAWSSAPVRGVESGDSAPFSDRGLSLAAVRNDPLLSEPDAFLALGGGEIGLSPESPSGIHVRGGGSDQTGYLLDGVPILSPYHAAGVFSAWNPDALERVDLYSSSPSPAFPDVLAGTVAGVTGTPGSRVQAQGSVSTMQARVTMDGPVGVGGAGFVVSYRSGLPGIVAPRNDPSYLTGRATDLLAKVEAPAFGGRVRLFGYDNANEIGSASLAAVADTVIPGAARNAFDWHSRSLGAEWSRRSGPFAVRVQGWSALGDGGARWNALGESPVDLASRRRDEGALAIVERSDAATVTDAGVRIQRSRTSYRLAHTGDGTPSLTLDAATPVGAIFFRHTRALGSRVTGQVALSASAASGSTYLAPRAQIRWAASRSLIITGSYARSHQFLQSLRNPESVVGNIFPVDLWIGAGAGGVPVAQSDQGVLAAEYRPRNDVRLAAQAYLRRSDGLILVPRQTGGPFATDAPAVGSGLSRGASLDVSVSRVRYGFVARYGWEHVRLGQGGASYFPTFGATHSIETGVIVFPSATSSIRLGVTGAFGRRATAVASDFEWEACNLLDRGCELGGSPSYRTDQVGATRLPPYVRLDLGVRKQWHVNVAGRDATVALFGTVTNLLGRRNVLTTATNSSTGLPVAIEMRPRAPLVVGLDWRF